MSHDPARPDVFAGVELGGTKCICTLATGPDELIEQVTIPTTSPGETLPAIEAVLARWWRSRPFAALGIGSFGPIQLDPNQASYGHILATSKPGWSSADVGLRLSRPFPTPFALETDVNGAALAELRWGCAQNLSDFAYITIGTGVGVGLIIGGRPHRGFVNPEMGHVPVPRLPGDHWPSGCPFHRDCVEGLASGTAIRAVLGETPVSEIGDDHPIWERVSNAIAALCHVLVCSVAPRRVALGGGVIDRQPHLLPRIEAMLRDSLAGYLELPSRHPYIVRPTLGARAGPLGAIALAIGVKNT